MLKTSGNHKNGGLYNNFFEKFEFRKKNAVKNETKILKNSFYANSFITNYIFMSNMNLDCFKLSFDIHIVHVDQKLRFFKNCGTES